MQYMVNFLAVTLLILYTGIPRNSQLIRRQGSLQIARHCELRGNQIQPIFKIFSIVRLHFNQFWPNNTQNHNLYPIEIHLIN